LRSLLRIHEHLLDCLNKVAIDSEGGVHPKHRLTQYHRFFLDRIVKGQSVLDVGCGVGAVAFTLAEGGAIVTGIDFDQKNLAVAQEKFRHPHLTFIRGDATQDAALPDSRFDVVVLSNVLEHIADRISLLKILQGRFQPGRFLIRVPMVDRDWLVPLRKELGMSYFSDDTHFVEYTWASFVQEMDEAGMMIVAHQVNWGEIWAECKAAQVEVPAQDRQECR
jgi:SAM-dependent methyltransferase